VKIENAVPGVRAVRAFEKKGVAGEAMGDGMKTEGGEKTWRTAGYG